jgi:hypothetical protein
MGDTPDIPCINELVFGLTLEVGTYELFMFVNAYLNL